MRSVRKNDMSDPEDRKFCSVARDGRLLMVTISRPEVLNALHRPANLELEKVFDEFARDPDLWVAIITGSGEKAFSAGNDLKYLASGNDSAVPASGFGGLTARFDLDKPVIAAVNGFAFGGGFELALSCDILVADERATFALPEPRVGLAATAGGLLRLPRKIHLKQAMGMVLTGRKVKADEGLRLGFVNEVAPAGELLTVAKRWADEILECSPAAIRAAKYLAVRSALGERFAEEYTAQKKHAALRDLYQSADYIEGPKAFSEKRRPVWTSST